MTVMVILLVVVFFSHCFKSVKNRHANPLKI